MQATAAPFDGRRRPHRGHLHRLLFDDPSPTPTAGHGIGEEYSEADVLWGSPAPDPLTAAAAAAASPAANPSPTKSLLKPRRSSARPSVAVPASMPVQIPDWSKILGPEAPSRRNRRGNGLPEDGSWGSVGGEDYFYAGADEDEDDDDDEDEPGTTVVPPHEYLCRRRRGASVAAAGGAAFSLCEGLGRTLKGRDLSRVRNAVWEKIGFQD